MICSVDSVNLTGGYALVSMFQAFCSTAMSGVGGVVLDINPRLATTYNNCRITQKNTLLSENIINNLLMYLIVYHNCCFSSCAAWCTYSIKSGYLTIQSA